MRFSVYILSFLMMLVWSSSAHAHPHLSEVAEIGPLPGIVDGFNKSWVRLRTEQGTATSAGTAASSACSTFSACYNVSLFHTATRQIINANIDRQFEEYAEWWQDVFWDDGIYPVLAKASEQISTSIAERPKIRLTTQDSLKANDGMHRIAEKKVEAVIKMTPSVEFCSYASIGGGVASAKESSRPLFRETMGALRTLAKSGHADLVDAPRVDRQMIDDTLCSDPNRNTTSEAFESVCPDVEPDIERSTLGDLAQKGNWDDDDYQAAIRGLNAIFLSNRPREVHPRIYDDTGGRFAYMNHRSVLSREMLGMFCALKSYQPRMGGSDQTLEYLDGVLEKLGIEREQREALLTDNPSLYSQREAIRMAVESPMIGSDAIDIKENVVRISNIIASYKLSAMYDNIDLMQCNQMMAAQLFLDALLPEGFDVQESIDSLRMVSSDPLDLEGIKYVQNAYGSVIDGGHK